MTQLTEILAGDIQRYMNDFDNDRTVSGSYSDYIARRLDEEKVLIPKAELPEVRTWLGASDTYDVDKENVVFTSEENAHGWVLRDVAVWQYIKAGNTAEARLQERRNEVIRNHDYDAAIDRILELEDEARS